MGAARPWAAASPHPVRGGRDVVQRGRAALVPAATVRLLTRTPEAARGSSRQTRARGPADRRTADFCLCGTVCRRRGCEAARRRTTVRRLVTIRQAGGRGRPPACRSGPGRQRLCRGIFVRCRQAGRGCFLYRARPATPLPPRPSTGGQLALSTSQVDARPAREGESVREAEERGPQLSRYVCGRSAGRRGACGRMRSAAPSSVACSFGAAACFRQE